MTQDQQQIIIEVFNTVKLKISGFRDINYDMFPKLKVDQIKQLVILISWIFNTEMPEKLVKKSCIEYLEQYIDTVKTTQPVWITPKKVINSQVFEAYVTLGKQFGAKQLQMAKGLQDFYIPRQVIPVQTLPQLSPLFDHFQVISLFQQDLEKDYKFQFDLPENSVAYLQQYQQCRLLMYSLYETLGQNNIPSIDVIPTQKIVNSNHHQQLLFANGISVVQERITNQKDTDTMIFPLPFDLTQASKLKSNKLFIDVQNISLPVHPDFSKEKKQYQLPYFIFFLAKKLSTEEIFSKLLKKPLLTCQLFKMALVEKQALQNNTILVVSTTAEDEEIEQISETISLVSHLSMKPIKYPVRSSQCRHFNKIMDLDEFLSRVESGLSFRCSICNEQCSFDQLHIDAFAYYLIQNNQTGSVEVQKDGCFELKEQKEQDEDSGWF